MSRLIQLVILSGKGGTGKTTVTAAFAHLAATSAQPVPAVLVDADVDASNLELVLDPTIQESHDFWGSHVAVIDPLLCGGCGTCDQVCRFDALLAPESPKGHETAYTIDVIACEGCAACVYQCPQEAIHMQPQLAGHWYRSHCRYGPLFHAALRPAQESSGKLVTTVREQARQWALDDGYRLVLLDGPPGIGCPAISAATGTDLALVVTEPTVAGIHDLQRVLQTTSHFNLPTWVCVNKADLYPAGTAGIERHCRDQNIKVMGLIPFDLSVTEAMVQGQPVTSWRPNSPAATALGSLWAHMLAAIKS
jgi:MinD superfamily P-loop ATPase